MLKLLNEKHEQKTTKLKFEFVSCLAINFVG